MKKITSIFFVVAFATSMAFAQDAPKKEAAPAKKEAAPAKKDSKKKEAAPAKKAEEKPKN
jgi:hypothetical protein